MDFTKINELRAKLKTMRPLNTDELKRLRDEFIIDNTYNSNAIEGNVLTLEETALILQLGITIAEKPIKDHLEAIGHKDAFEYIIQLADDETNLTEHVIKTVHSLVLINDANNRGIYRSLPVKIIGSEHIPPQPYLVAVQMEELVQDYTKMQQEKHIIEAIAEFHLRFESIHPFIDGNGRTGRLLMNLELIKAGMMPAVNIKFTDRLKYYNTFDAYRNGNDIEAMTTLIANYEVEELEKNIQILAQ
ncbi:Fic family protein [Propionispira raffinosivorans]|uniref:Fic family protein n=1 Tax=Propionispira raffinosivorans TaxID=86959 RepID=UPI00037E0250|nr:Fic family protein [Propionispira raffinosivorans]